MKTQQSFEIKKMKNTQRGFAHKNREQYEELCNKITCLEQKIDAMGMELKNRMENLSEENAREVSGNLKNVEELLRILIANELLDEFDK